MMLKFKVMPVACVMALVGCSAGSDAPDGIVSAPEALSSSSSPHIATGGAHACVIFNAGQVLCWGDNSYGQLGNGTTDQSYGPVVVSGISTAVSVAAGDNHSCAVLTDSTVRCWGRNNSGQLGNATNSDSYVPVAVSGISTATAVATGGSHSCARLSNSTLKCWGYGIFGQLGDGTNSSSNTPLSVSGITTATAVAGGYLHTCARLSNSSVRCWGAGDLGNGGPTGSATPVTVSGISTATAVAAGAEHSCAILSNGTVKCWGRNAEGQGGDGTNTTPRKTPVTVTGLSNATSIGLGPYHSCATLGNATVKCWGYGASGQLGNGTSGLFAQTNTPVVVTGVSNAAEVSGGGSFLSNNFTCALLTGGGIQCWGSNAGGQLGRGTADVLSLPVRTLWTTLNRATAVASGATHTCVLWDAGSVKCWGSNASGQLGNGTTKSSNAPVDVLGISTATAIAAGNDHTCARLSDSTVKCWGSNGNGQLGNNSTSNSSSPVTVSGISSATAIGLGTRHSCAVSSDSTLRCWGRNANGELGNGSTVDAKTPVVVSGISDAVAVMGGGDTTSGTGGSGHTCALSTAGGVKCWGKNTYGQLGTGNTTNTTTPVQISDLTSGVAALSLAMYSSCARLTNGSVECWGRNNYGQLGDASLTQRNAPVAVSGISTATAIGSGTGGNHVCAALSNKSVQCWGYNATGQLGNGTKTSSSVPVTAIGVDRAASVGGGGSHSCVRRDDSTLMCWGSETSGQLATGHTTISTTAAAPPCRAFGVERSDYFVSVTTANMPDPALDGLAASLDVHRVKPVMFPESCTPEKAIVMVHGRTVEATSAFDLQYQDYSVMEQLALAGIDSFAMNHLGFGRSSGLGVMDDACNASLPACLDIGQTCPPPVGVKCDCGLAATFGVNDKNQQGNTRYLNPNPLTSTCFHTSNTRLNSSATMVADVDAVVNDALSKSSLTKVSLLGYSAGGIDVGNWMSDADDTTRAARLAKIDKAIFVSSLFGLPQVTDTEPNTATTVMSYPLGVMDRGSATAGGFNLDLVACPGQRDDGIVDPIWASVKSRDSVGSTWGPSQTPTENGGLSRFAHATRWGWNAAAAARITVPVLVMQGLRDNVVPVASSSNLYNALTGTSSKTIVQVNCASHSIFWEGCSGSTCNGWTGPHATIRKNINDWIQSGMIYASPGQSNGSFGSTPEDGTNYHTDNPISNGPDADESNQLP
jgi:alpha-tubulin suppressor-like RCC1 family protein/alpha-beta hydrolase superfamily lysophospholipase